ncbi:tail fiber assembly protein [Photorhabdus hainanensis]|uniref:tail fiber assembly protein n=1 Tax=Photorhabdus hainanensis TaxID=1004166 RepID=UPI001BD6D6CD|nr:tail fiber assembly protein [Photorhabdus hainanensis]MBS9431276.1 tail fiber assembly protein [Photorhabdus hainanensis]
MKYYKSTDNKIYAFASDGSQDAWIEPSFTLITESEVDEILNPPPTSKQLQQRAESQKRSLLSRASTVITPLQYAVDLQMATDAEQSKLTEWKRYCVLLNRVDCSTAPSIDWPKAPE